jgi:beta-glucosidase
MTSPNRQWHCLWGRYEEDIAIAADIGSNALRLSLEWSRIYPRRGTIDKAAIQHYHKIFDCMERWGPILTALFFAVWLLAFC